MSNFKQKKKIEGCILRGEHISLFCLNFGLTKIFNLTQYTVPLSIPGPPGSRKRCSKSNEMILSKICKGQYLLRFWVTGSLYEEKYGRFWACFVLICSNLGLRVTV